MYQKKLANVSTAQCLNFSENVVSPKKKKTWFSAYPTFRHIHISYIIIYIYCNHIYIYIYCNHIYILYSYMVFIGLISIWLLVEPYPSEKWWSEFVSWDDDIPNMMGKSFKIPWLQSPPTSIYCWGFPHMTTPRFFFLFGSDHSVAYPICRWRKKL